MLRLQTAIRAARAGGRVLHARFDSIREVRSKGKRDIVTDADYAAERAVQEVLLGRWPQDRFVSEEGSAAEHRAIWAELESSPDLFAWIVDPLDGTTNYARRQPIFTVSIGLYRAGAVQAGVVLDPIRNELFAAERGKGATLEGKPIRVSEIGHFDDAVMSMDWGRAQPVRKRSAQLLARMVARATSARTTGSAALSLAYLAAGRTDAYFHLSLWPWDVAAGALIVEEAGGCVTDPTGAPWTVHSGGYVATNGRLHTAMLRFFHS